MKTMFVTIGLATLALAAWGQCPDSGGSDYELPLGTFMEVTAYSNGDYTEKPCDPVQAEYQCVELTKRFAAKYHTPLSGGVGGSAATMWDKLPRDYGYQAIPNKDVVKPQVGDFIIWWGNTYGHVAIVCWVTSSEIGVFEQNIENSTKPFRNLPMTKTSDGKWSVGPGPRLSNYEVKGWLRHPSFMVPVGMEFDGTSNQEFTGAYSTYDSQSHYLLGNTRDNGGGPFVHDWDGIEVQDFEHGVLVKNPSTNQVFPIVGGFFNVWLGNGGPAEFGAPFEAERYSVNWAEQEFEYATFRWDGAKVRVYDIDGNELNYGIAALPGDGQTLTLWADALSSNSVYLSNNEIVGATEYWYYRNGQFIGSDTNFELTDTGLAPNTTYSYQVFAVDAGANVIVQSETKSVTTPAQTGPENLTVVLVPRTTSLEVSCTAVGGASYYSVKLNGSFLNTYANPFFTINGVSPGSTYTVRVEAYSGAGVLLATGSKSI